MASSDIQPDSDTSVDKLTECSICKDRFTQPKLLPCSHTFCLKCITQWYGRVKSTDFNCPLCRQKVPVPKGGLQSLPANVFIEKILECIIIGRSNELLKSDIESDAKLCRSHVEEEVREFCSDCSELICAQCPSHREHKCRPIETAVKLQKRIQSNISRIERILIQQRKAADNLLETKQLMSLWLTETTTAICNAAEATKKRANDEKDILMERLESFKTESFQKWQTSKNKVDEQITKVSSFLELLPQLVTRSDPVVLSLVLRDGRWLADRFEKSECDISAGNERLSADIDSKKKDFMTCLPDTEQDYLVGRLAIQGNQKGEGLFLRALTATMEELLKNKRAFASKESERTELEAKLTNRIKKLEEKNRTLEERLKLANDRCNDFRQKRDDENKSTKILLKKSRQEFTKLKEEYETLLSDCRQKLDFWGLSFNVCKIQLEELKVEHCMTLGKYKDVQQELQVLKNERLKAPESSQVTSSQVKDLKGKLESTTKLVDGLKQEIRRLNTENEQWGVFCNTCKREFQRLQDDIRRTKNSFKNSELENQKLRNENFHPRMFCDEMMGPFVICIVLYSIHYLLNVVRQR